MEATGKKKEGQLEKGKGRVEEMRAWKMEKGRKDGGGRRRTKEEEEEGWGEKRRREGRRLKKRDQENDGRGHMEKD